MVRKELIEKLKKISQTIMENKKVLAVLLFGSQLDEEHVTERSDIDICIVAPEHPDPLSLELEAYKVFKEEIFDVKVFERLPLYLKVEVIKKHVVIHARDPPSLYEYFYFYRKLWEDQEKRNTVSEIEIRNILKSLTKRAKSILSGE